MAKTARRTVACPDCTFTTDWPPALGQHRKRRHPTGATSPRRAASSVERQPAEVVVDDAQVTDERTFTITADSHDVLDAVAWLTGTTPPELVRQVVASWVDEQLSDPTVRRMVTARHTRRAG